MASFVVENVLSIRDHTFVFARHLAGPLMDLAAGARLDGAQIEPRYDQPRALDSAGAVRLDLYAF
jgi:hypothetical protein